MKKKNNTRQIRIDDETWETLQKHCIRLGYIKCKRPSVSALLEAIVSGQYLEDIEKIEKY